LVAQIVPTGDRCIGIAKINGDRGHGLLKII